jgi:tetratricopeptide (TPR) repeat protein
MVTRNRIAPALVAAVLTFAPTIAFGQTPGQKNARELARAPYESGIDEMRREAYEAAVKSFRTAVEIDPLFEMAHYMLGRAHLAPRNYTSAVYALERSQTLFVAQGTEQFTDKQERQHVLRQRVGEIDQLITDLRAAAALPANAQKAFSLNEQARQYEERKRQINDLIRYQDTNLERVVPGFVSLSLGSAYFRAGRTSDAERAYLAAIAADPKIGEAHNNLAVIYMETGRLDDAERALSAAEKAGLRVNPALKDEIKKRKKA